MVSGKAMYEIRQKLFKNKKYLNSIILAIASVLLFIILIVCFIFIVGPMKDKYETQLNTIFEYKEKASQIDELKDISQSLSELTDSMNTIESAINDIVPDRKNIPYVTSQISLAAEKNNVRITSMNKVAERNTTLGEYSFNVVRYSLDLIASYEDTVNFLATLETTKSIFKIANISISPVSQEVARKYNDPSLVKIELIVDIYMKE